MHPVPKTRYGWLLNEFLPRYRRRPARPERRERLGCPSAATYRWHWRTRSLSKVHLAPLPRPSALSSRNSMDGHANATIVDPEGLEIRRDAWISVSLMAPHMRYPDHRHPPEEIYVVLSDGQWRQASDPWHEPGIGGLVYNPPNVVHAMRSTERPLLALWFLWTGQISS